MVTTLNTADTVRAFKHDILIIDEAGQGLEADCLIPFRASVKAVVMVGDEKQLAPTVISREDENEFHAQMSISLFERLKRYGLPHIFLNEQYRSVREIVEHTNQTVYQGLVHNSIWFEGRPTAIAFRAWARQNHGKEANELFFNVSRGQAQKDPTAEIRASMMRTSTAPSLSLIASPITAFHWIRSPF